MKYVCRVRDRFNSALDETGYIVNCILFTVCFSCLFLPSLQSNSSSSNGQSTLPSHTSALWKWKYPKIMMSHEIESFIRRTWLCSSNFLSSVIIHMFLFCIMILFFVRPCTKIYDNLLFNFNILYVTICYLSMHLLSSLHWNWSKGSHKELISPTSTQTRYKLDRRVKPRFESSNLQLPHRFRGQPTKSLLWFVKP